jgi:uncharacterized protein
VKPLRTRWAMALLMLLVTLGATAALRAQSSSLSRPITEASAQQLERWLQQYPDADVNRDGVLTIDEAEAYRRKLVTAGQRESDVRPTFNFRHEYTFATMSDGVQIALAVGYPRTFDPTDSRTKWPAIFRTSGYPGTVVPANPAEFGDRYVTVHASIRGTGASGGTFGPWEPRTWMDGHEIIEQWIVRQPWSSGKVGIHGFSWPGLLGFLTAATQPPSLKAVCVGGLIDDFYHGICYPGGIRNSGFPVDWINNFYRTDGVFGSDAAARLARGLDDASYQAIVEARPPQDLTRDPLWRLLHQPLDDPEWRAMSLNTYAEHIRAPIMITHAWQDEQTGPSGWKLWTRLPEDVPKRLIAGNGDHGTCPRPLGGVRAWFDHWLLDEPHAPTADPAQRVEIYFEHRGVRDGGEPNSPWWFADFPPLQTRWTRLYLRASQTLTAEPPAADEPSSRYRILHSPSPDQQQQVHYRVAFDKPTVICGPATLTLWAELTTIDTDFFVLLADQGPDGRVYGLQRALLRASHRTNDSPPTSDAERDHAKRGAQLPENQRQSDHVTVQPVTPRQAIPYTIEIPAVGHIFRPGHHLVLVISRPPSEDPIGVTRSGAASYRYASNPPPGIVRILQDEMHPSHLLLPVQPELPPLGDPVPLAEQAGLQTASMLGPAYPARASNHD